MGSTQVHVGQQCYMILSATDQIGKAGSSFSHSHLTPHSNCVKPYEAVARQATSNEIAGQQGAALGQWTTALLCFLLQLSVRLYSATAEKKSLRFESLKACQQTLSAGS